MASLYAYKELVRCTYRYFKGGGERKARRANGGIQQGNGKGKPSTRGQVGLLLLSLCVWWEKSGRGESSELYKLRLGSGIPKNFLWTAPNRRSSRKPSRTLIHQATNHTISTSLDPS
jgi:hypothetical protein